MKALVTGGCGLIGSHFVDLAMVNGYEVVVVDNLSRGKYERVEKHGGDPKFSFYNENIARFSVESVAPDYVFHFAGHGIQAILKDDRLSIENVTGCQNVFHGAARCGAKVMFSSTASVYGDAVEKPMTENHPLNGRTIYAGSKLYGEILLKSLHDRLGLEYVTFRYMNVYGPRMDVHGAFTTVITKGVKRCLDGSSPLVYGDGEQAYDFVYVEDVARANLLAAESEVSDVVINVSTGMQTSIRDLMTMIVDKIDPDLGLEYKPDAGSVITDRVGSTARGRALIGFEAETDLDVGLNKTINWFRENI